MEEKLDRVMVTKRWWDLFHLAKAWNMEVSYSNHSPILVELTSQIMEVVACRFRFENAWIKEKDCATVVASSWTETTSLSIKDKISFCGSRLMDWSGKLVGDFKKRISYCKKKMKALHSSHDMRDVLEYKQCCEDLNYVLHHQHVFWKQRAKKHWLKEGDINSRFFHASASAR